jgi:HD superfamily phosphohydrolase YqeK
MAPNSIKADLARRGRSIPPEDRDHPKVWHGLHASVWAEQDLGVRDEAVLEAVALHTTCDAGAGPLTRAIFVSDFCEPGRKNPQAPEILAVARRDLDEAFRRALVAKTRHMLGRKKFVLHPRARRAIEEWLEPEVMEELLKTRESKIEARKRRG